MTAHSERTHLFTDARRIAPVDLLTQTRCPFDDGATCSGPDDMDVPIVTPTRNVRAIPVVVFFIFSFFLP
jgi:hypothetical protein